MALTSISLTPQFGNNTVTAINCGTSSPRLSGTIDVSAFPSLTGFICNSNDITAVSASAQNSNLRNVQFSDNKVTGSIPSLNGLTNLQIFLCNTNQLTGSIPSLNGLTNLQNFSCGNQTGATKITGSIPSLNGLTNLQNFNCDRNQLTGPIPSLNGLVNLITFNCFLNPLSGFIPSLDGLTDLQVLRCYSNGLTGPIPDMSQATSLELVFCYSQQLSGFAGGSVSNTLGHFVAANNPLNQSSIDAILSAFVVAGRTNDTPVAGGPCLLNIGGFGASAPSYTGGVTTTSAGTNFTRSGTLVTVTNNITPHGHVNGNIVTITGITPTVFQGTFAVTRITDNQFRYTTISSGAATGAGTATMRKTSDATSGYASYQNLALVSRTGGPWTVSINQP